MAKKQENQTPTAPQVPAVNPDPDDSDVEPEIAIDGTLTAMSRPRYRGNQVFSSVDPSTEAGKKAIFNAISGRSVPLREAEGKVIAFVGYIAQRGMIHDGEGKEPRLGVKLLVLDADGTRYYSTAASVLAAVDRILAFYGPGPYDPPIDLRVTKGLTQAGRQWYSVELV